MRKILFVLSLMLAIVSCKKDDEELTPAEKSVADNETIIEYLKEYRLVDFYPGMMLNNIDWQMEKIPEEELETSESLYDLMSENVIETSFEGVDYKIYYYIIDEGEGGVYPETEDNIVVDYNGFNLTATTVFDESVLAPLQFQLESLIPGWKEGLLKFKTGVKPEGFPLDPESDYDYHDPYREQIVNPGRGFLIIPGGMAYGNIVRFDIVLYDKITPETEEE